MATLFGSLLRGESIGDGDRNALVGALVGLGIGVAIGKYAFAADGSNKPSVTISDTSGAEEEAAPLTLGYWSIRGLGQSCRLALAYSQGDNWRETFYEQVLCPFAVVIYHSMPTPLALLSRASVACTRPLLTSFFLFSFFHFTLLSLSL